MKLKHLKQELFFYISVITAVVALFATVSSYGEANLKANPSINGVYRLQQGQSSQDLPSCLETTGETTSPWLLVLHQSGVFLNASLVKPAPEWHTSAQSLDQVLHEPTTLTGRFENQAIALNGQLTNLASCQNSSNVHPTPITIQATVEQRTLIGTLELGTGAIGFRGEWQESPLSSSQPEVKGH